MNKLIIEFDSIIEKYEKVQSEIYSIINDLVNFNGKVKTDKKVTKIIEENVDNDFKTVEDDLVVLLKGLEFYMILSNAFKSIKAKYTEVLKNGK